jgi:hypothetical protein
MYHTLIQPLPSPPLSPSSFSWKSFNRYNFCTYIHVYTIFAPYSPSYPQALPPVTVTNSLHRTCTCLMFFSDKDYFISEFHIFKTKFENIASYVFCLHKLVYKFIINFEPLLKFAFIPEIFQFLD